MPGSEKIGRVERDFIIRRVGYASTIIACGAGVGCSASVRVVVEIFPQGERWLCGALEGAVIASTVSGGEFPRLWSVGGCSGRYGADLRAVCFGILTAAGWWI